MYAGIIITIIGTILIGYVCYMIYDVTKQSISHHK